MFINEVQIKNFRLLKDVSLTFDKETTVIVGRNNSGKTSLTEIFRRFFSGKSPSFQLEDFSLDSLQGFKSALQAKLAEKSESDIRALIPTIDLTLLIDYSSDITDFGLLNEFIIDLDENSIKAKIRLSYQLIDGKIDAFFVDLTEENKSDFFKKLRDRIPKMFNTLIIAIDPTDSNNFTTVDYKKLYNLLGADFICAQRGLDDETQSERDVLGKVLSNIFKNASLDTASEEMKEKSQLLEGVVRDLQDKVDTDFKDKVDALLPALKLFGYPGLADPKLSTETTLNLQTILEKNTKIRYMKEEVTLPETYNGLGTRNLIYILFQLFEYFRKYQSSTVQVRSHIIFIEEPEAHLHPQMQEVFIQQLNQIAKVFSKTLNDSKSWPVQFVVSTHSTHIANRANFESIRYFLTSNGKFPETKIKDLRVEFNVPDNKKDKEFIHKYLTLTRCDLFFADKAMLIEGPTERLLMPMLIKKVDEEISVLKLESQYVSIVEIGGAYAHHFYKFLDFLELKTLIITDLDSTKKTKTKDSKTVYKACIVSDGTHTSNAGIINWFKKTDEYVDLVEIRTKTEIMKIECARRIAFQVPEPKKTACGRSFEDAFILANRELFKMNDIKEKAAEKSAYTQAETIKKTNFALKYALDDTTWSVPLYIKEGLLWLAEAPKDETNKLSDDRSLVEED